MTDPHSSTPRVSVILISYRSASILPFTAASLGGACGDLSYEIIAIDNASSDDSAATLGRLFPHGRLIVNQRNLGFARACNQAAALAQGEWLLFLNPDVALDPEAVAHLVEAGSRQDAGLIVPRLRIVSGAFHPTCRAFPTPYSLILSRGSVIGWLYEQITGRVASVYTLPDYPAITEVPAVAATVALIRKSVFERVGRFDDRFFLYMEDTDLSFRLVQSGYRNLFVPKAGGVHRWREGSNVWLPLRIARQHYAVWQYFLKHSPNGYSLIVLPVLLAINFALSLLRGFFSR